MFEKMDNIRNKEKHDRLIKVTHKMKELNEFLDEELCDDCNNVTHCQIFWYSQIKYSQCFKLIVLFILAVSHLYYIQPFLRTYSAYEDHVHRIYDYADTYRVQGHVYNQKLLQAQIDVLTDYKKNMWMTVGSMCVSLSISCFFMFIVPFTSMKSWHSVFMKIIDFVAFSTLPVLLWARSVIVTSLHALMDIAAVEIPSLESFSKLARELGCSLNIRSKKIYCQDYILQSIFPVLVLKYLMILCILTAAYVLLAYLIAYCIRHWFPHGRSYSMESLSSEDDKDIEEVKCIPKETV
uniref:Lysosomal protein transmembrane 5 n=1 Tax=Parastrongyloides trichosuri TaxID=131310 RepID=A0A0N4ZHN2_PARTI